MAAVWLARVVLPTPPMPMSVTRRQVDNNSCSWANSASRPTKLATVAGSLPPAAPPRTDADGDTAGLVGRRSDPGPVCSAISATRQTQLRLRPLDELAEFERRGAVGRVAGHG